MSRPDRPPTAIQLFVGPLLAGVGAVLVAALHKWLGSPLGERWAEKLWSLAEYGITTLLVYGGFAGAVQRANALQAAERRRALQPGSEDDDPAADAATAPPPRRLPARRRRTDNAPDRR